jgi:glucosamine-phosphate N-acetyltransferase
MIRFLAEIDFPEFSLLFNYNIDETEFKIINFERLKQGVKTIVGLQDDKIVGTASYFIESKFLHNGGKVMHIEDVVVVENHRGVGIGKMLILHLVNLGKNENCYKVILDCNENNVMFYEKCGFKKHEIQMRKQLIFSQH